MLHLFRVCFLGDGQDIGFLDGGEECLQRKSNDTIDIAFIQNILPEVLVILAVQYPVRYHHKCLSPGFQGLDDSLHEKPFYTHSVHLIVVHKVPVFLDLVFQVSASAGYVGRIGQDQIILIFSRF